MDAWTLVTQEWLPVLRLAPSPHGRCHHRLRFGTGYKEHLVPIDFTALEPDGLQLHILLNNLLSKRGFFSGMDDAEKKSFDSDVECIIREFLQYDDGE